MVVHFSFEGYMLAKDSSEHQEQDELLREKNFEIEEAIKAAKVEEGF